MSVNNVVFYETPSPSPVIPILPHFRESHQAYHCDSKEMTPQLIQKANEESSVFQKGVGSRKVTILPTSSCLFGLTSGITALFLLKNPLPLLFGVSGCFPRAYAQQKVGNEFQVNTYTTLGQQYPSVASFNNGNFVVTWNSDGQDGNTWGVYGQLFNGNASKIGSELRANSYTTLRQYDTAVASFSNGNFVVTWSSSGQDSSGFGIYGQLFNGNGSKIGSEFRANSYVTFDQRDPSVASFSNGNFVVTWESFYQDGSWDGVYGQLFDGNGTKVGSEFRANSYVTLDQRDPSVASFSNGNFVVTWDSDGQDGSSYGVYGQLFDGNGSNIGSEFLVNSYTNNSQTDPSVASFPNGNFVVIWESLDQDGSSFGVYGQLFNGNGTKIGSELLANSYTTNSQRYPSVASFSNGNFVLSWQSDGQDGSLYGVYVQLFNGTGTKLGSEFRANSYTTSDQGDSSVATFSNGNFVVTWHSDGQDGSGYGNFGQIFHDNITYPSSSTTTSSSTTSTTKTTSSTTSISSSTMSAIGRTRTSVNPSSTTKVPSTIRPITTSDSRATLSGTPDPSNRFSWVWFLLGGVGIVSCLGLSGYFIFKSRIRQKDGDVTFEFGEREQTDESTAETQYQRTPDVVKPEDGYGYQRTPDVVKPEDGYGYQRTPNFLTEGGGVK